MTAAMITRLTRTGFEAVPVMKERAIELSLFGNGDMTVSAALKSYLKEFDGEARRHGVTAVHVELGDLYFLSSSCLQAIAGWLLLVASRPSAESYRVVFKTHAARDWQRRSLEAIRRLAPHVVTVV
jgi:hypothetical protein